ncbi:beta-1,3-galactosyltransferase 5-like [Panonychus citri]|uniref:beta-1,3-galactosyltransferase 5-like n=1 Tax=Panonychus citri TaxID=50023 RepID=UPI002306E30C|nr:beta-1,3-galactosyltransferase 5-like [Panonychus citri]XP_053209149.1 beta-1,3-galactosyltransferase 5-like [Panonychus citri]
MGKLFLIFLPILIIFCVLYVINQTSNPVFGSHQVYSTYYRHSNVPKQLESNYYSTLDSDYPFQLIRTINVTNSTDTGHYSVIGDKICPQGLRKLIVLVMIAPKDRETRDTIRQTWGSFRDEGLSYGFLIAQSEEEETIKLLSQESSIERDLIIDSSFIDSYDNLTLKSISMVDWASAYCPDAVAILKTDSDMWINVPLLLSKVHELSPGLHGKIFTKAKPIRDRKNKWFVPKGQYRGNFFPSYLSGTAYLMVNRGTNLFTRLYQNSLSTNYLRMEDIFLTGLVASRAKIKLYNLKNINYKKVPFSVCIYRNLISSHEISNEEKYLYWQLLESAINDTCPT